MDRVKYVYFTSIIWTILVLSLLIVFFYKSSEYKSTKSFTILQTSTEYVQQNVTEDNYFTTPQSFTDFTVKSNCSERNATREQCLCSPEFCVNKCCAWGQEPALDVGTGMYGCNHTLNETLQTKQKKMFPVFLQDCYTSPDDTAPKLRVPEDHFKIYSDFLTSETKKAQNEMEFNGSVLLFQNGTVQRIYDGWYRNPSEYCLDTFFDTDMFYFFDIPSDDIAINITTTNIPKTKDDESVSVLRTVLISVSVFFFILTLLVYAVLPRLQTLRGKCLMCYFMCMLIGYVGLLYFLRRDQYAENYVETCFIMGEFSILFR